MINNIVKGVQIGIGIVLVFIISGISYAAYSWIVENDVISNDTLTSTSWNNILNNQRYLKQQIEGISFTDTKLTESEVDAYVSNNGYLTSYTDTNTQLTEAEVDLYVSNNGYLTSADTTPDTIADDGTISSNEITDNTITEVDISDSFKARDSDLLDGLDSSLYATKTYVDNSISSSGGGTRVEKWSGSSRNVTNSWGIGEYKIIVMPSSSGYWSSILDITTTSGNYMFSGMGGGHYYASSSTPASYLNLYNKFYSGNTSWYIKKIYKWE